MLLTKFQASFETQDRATVLVVEKRLVLKRLLTLGSTLCGVFEGAVHGVTLGCTNGDPDVEIGRHIFVGSKASWEVIPDGVITFEER
jgi:hypothetical protein